MEKHESKKPSIVIEKQAEAIDVKKEAIDTNDSYSSSIARRFDEKIIVKSDNLTKTPEARL